MATNEPRYTHDYGYDGWESDYEDTDTETDAVDDGAVVGALLPLPGARGRLAQWTCADGRVITDPAEAQPGDVYDSDGGIPHLGQSCTCVGVEYPFYHAFQEDRGYIADVQFDDGRRCWAYLRNCVFD